VSQHWAGSDVAAFGIIGGQGCRVVRLRARYGWRGRPGRIIIVGLVLAAFGIALLLMRRIIEIVSFGGALFPGRHPYPPGRVQGGRQRRTPRRDGMDGAFRVLAGLTHRIQAEAGEVIPGKV